jgi:uncharacterized protein (DUF58 family)
MTKRGIGLLIFSALLLFFGKLTGSSEIFYALFCMGILLIASLLTALSASLFLQFSFQSPESAVVRGEHADIRLTCSGVRILPVFLSVRIGLENGPVQEYGIQMLPGLRRVVYSLPLDCRHRGLWHLQVKRLRVRDLFGLFSLPAVASGRKEGGGTLVVYPCLHAAVDRDFPLPSNMAYSEDRLVTSEAGDSSAGVRAYREGDSLKRIHWKLTAKMREPFTRQYEIPSEQYALVLMDNRVPTAPSDIDAVLEYTDITCECMGELALNYAARNYRVRLIVPGMETGDVAVESIEEFDMVYELLATAPFVGYSSAIEELDRLCHHTMAAHSLYYITGDASEQTLEYLQTIAVHHCPVTCVLIDMTLADPYLTRIGGIRTLRTADSRDIALLWEGES